MKEAYDPFAPKFNRDGYPTRSTVQIISKWQIRSKHWADDCAALLSYVRKCWAFRDYFTSNGGYYQVSTAGWSGNERVIEALQANKRFWRMCWQESKRGGHYKFEIRRIKASVRAAREEKEKERA